MSYNKVNPYNIDTHIAKIFDQQQDYGDDMQLMLELIGNRDPLHIFEPFSYTL